MRKNLAVVGLVLIAAVQIGLLATGVGGERRRWLRAGDLVDAIEVVDGEGLTSGLAFGEPALLLVFHSECGHCARVAPQWRQWLQEHATEARIVAVSSESYRTASAYALQQRWSVDVRVVQGVRRGSLAHALTSRTPWLFALAADGTVLSEGTGTHIEEIGRLVLAGTAP